jgi:hypothetical protein
MTSSAMSLPGPALWVGAGAIAIACHLVLVQQGLAAMGTRVELPPTATIPEIEIMAVALSVAGEERVAEVAKPVSSETLSSRNSADRAEKLTANTATRLEAPKAARLAALSPSAKPATVAAASAPTAAAAVSTPSVSAVASVPAVATNVPKIAIAAAAQPAASAAAVAISPSPTATPKSGVSRVAANAAPVPKAPGLSAPIAAARPATASSATAPRTVASANAVSSAAAPRVAAAAPSPKPKTSLSPIAEPAVSSANRVGAVAAASPTTSLSPVAEAAASSANRVAAIAATPPAANTATAVEPVGSLPPPATAVARDGIAAASPDIETLAPANETTYLSVLDVLAEVAKGPCFAALPTLSDQSEFQLEAFARNDTDLDAFQTELETRLGRMPNTTMKQISDAQCAALSFISEGPAYPRFKLFFEIDKRVIASGEAVVGRIGNTTGGNISFLVIDDEGTVQDLAFYLHFVPGGAKFDIPLQLTAGPVETQQLLMAISTPARLQTVIEANGAKAADFFPLLAEELRARGQTEDVAIVAFSVR